MSVRAMKAFSAVALDAPMKPVLLALAWHHQDGKGCYPSNATLAKFTGYSASTVRRALRKLGETGHAVPTDLTAQGTLKWHLNANPAPNRQNLEQIVAAKLLRKFKPRRQKPALKVIHTAPAGAVTVTGTPGQADCPKAVTLTAPPGQADR